MNSATGTMAISSVLGSQQSSPEPDSTAGDGAGFTAALAAAGSVSAEAEGEIVTSDSIATVVGADAGADAARALLATMLMVARPLPLAAAGSTDGVTEPVDGCIVDAGSAAATGPVMPSATGFATNLAQDAAFNAALAAQNGPTVVGAAEQNVESLAERELRMLADARSALPRTRTPVTAVSAAVGVPAEIPSGADTDSTAVAAQQQMQVAAVTRLVALFPAAGEGDESVATSAAAPQGLLPTTSSASTDVSMVAGNAIPEADGRVRTAVGSTRWADEMGSRVVLMAARGQKEGSLILTPEHLGPLEVRISVSNESTNVWFGAQHPDARAAISEALPRLRELFAASGLSLGQASVSQQAPQQRERDASSGQFAGRVRGDVQSNDVTTPAIRRIHSSLIDTYA